MVIKRDGYEFGDITFVVDDKKNRRDELRGVLSGSDELKRCGFETVRFSRDCHVAEFMTADPGEMPGSMYIRYPERVVRPDEANDFVMRLGTLASMGKRIVVLTRDYFILGYAAVIDAYKNKLMPDGSAEWRFIYGDGDVAGHDVDKDFSIYDTAIGRAMDDVYDFEQRLIYGDN